MENFKIKGVCIDTSNLSYIIYSGGVGDFNYVHTSLRSNNDTILTEYVGKVLKDAPLITTTTFLDKLNTALVGHLEVLDRKNIDLLLIDSECKISDHIVDIKEVLDNGLVSQIGVRVSSKRDNVEELEKIIEELKSIMLVKYIALDVCPLNFDYNIITWAREKDLKIIGFNPFGGRYSSGIVIDSFTIPYLLGFSANYCDIVCLSSNDIYGSTDCLKYLSQLIDTESHPKYTLKKSIHKLVKPLKRVINTSLKISDNFIIPYNNSEAIFNPQELLLDFKATDLVNTQEVTDELIPKISDYIKLVSKPEDGDIKDYFTILCPKVYLLLKSILGKDWKIVATPITDTITVFVTSRLIKRKKWYNFKKDELVSRAYALCQAGDDIVFLSLGNAFNNSSKS